MPIGLLPPRRYEVVILHPWSVVDHPFVSVWIPIRYLASFLALISSIDSLWRLETIVTHLHQALRLVIWMVILHLGAS